jgi:hypothetical protein
MLDQHDPTSTPLHLVSQAASPSLAGQLPRPDSVKAGLTSKRPRRRVENDEYAAFVQRILRAYSRRVGDGDIEALALMLGLAEDIDAAIAMAVKRLAGARLLLGRDRLPARHYPPGRPPAMGLVRGGARGRLPE